VADEAAAGEPAPELVAAPPRAVAEDLPRALAGELPIEVVLAADLLVAVAPAFEAGWADETVEAVPGAVLGEGTDAGAEALRRADPVLPLVAVAVLVAAPTTGGMPNPAGEAGFPVAAEEEPVEPVADDPGAAVMDAVAGSDADAGDADTAAAAEGTAPDADDADPDDVDPERGAATGREEVPDADDEVDTAALARDDAEAAVEPAAEPEAVECALEAAVPVFRVELGATAGDAPGRGVDTCNAPADDVGAEAP